MSARSWAGAALAVGLAGAGYGLAGLWQPSSPPHQGDAVDRPSGRTSGLSEPQRLLVGGSVALAAGVAKEVLDLTIGLGTPSWKDLAWDVAGTAAGLALAWAVDRFVVQPLRRVADGRMAFQGCGEWNHPISLCW